MHQKIFYPFLLVLLLTNLVQAQSITANVSASGENLSYATIHIYRGSNRVASLITDDKGAFKIALDTGWYRCEILYVGHLKEVRKIHVSGDEKANFILKEDERKKKELPGVSEHKSVRAERTYDEPEYAPEVDEVRDVAFKSLSRGSSGEGRVGATTSTPDTKASLKPDMPIRPEIQPQAGSLTAGEINDFSRWKLWNDLNEGELEQYRMEWNTAAGRRYGLQLTNQDGLPLADFWVLLIHKSGDTLWQSKTDNTGKAELWSGLNEVQGSTILEKDLQLLVIGRASRHKINRPKEITQGMNALSIDIKCNQSTQVDIAFVVDATGSMGDEIEFLKTELNDVIFQAKQGNPEMNMRFASVFYRDHGDEYLTRQQDFTEVLSEAQAFISMQNAAGGGDYPEAVEEAMDVAVNSLTWSPSARARMLFLVLDAPPHNNPHIQKRLQSMARNASAKGIRIVPVVASGINKSAEYLLRNIALASNGTYVFLTDHSGIGAPHMKPSTDTFSVESLNALLVRLVKQYTYQPDCSQQLKDELINSAANDSLLSMDLPATNNDTALMASNDSLRPIPSKGIQMQWKYYPNPCRGMLTVEADGVQSEQTLYITDFSGKLIRTIEFRPEISRVQIDLRAYASGIYLLRYPSGDHWISKKFVLIR